MPTTSVIDMAEVSVVGPDDGERLHIGSAVTMRVLEDGETTGHRPHTFANPSDEPARALTTFTPATYTGYFRELAVARPDEIGALMARYATVVTDEYAP